MCFCNSSDLSECAISKVKDLPDHVNESEIHFSTMLSLPPAIWPWGNRGQDGKACSGWYPLPELSQR